MKNMNYARKYHYMLKYFIMALPLLLIFFMSISICSSLNMPLGDLITYVKEPLDVQKNIEIKYWLSDNISQGWYGLVFKSFRTFYSLPINSWYYKILETIGLTFRTSSTDAYDFLYHSSLPNFLLFYPLYIMWVYIFDLILDIFCFLPKLAHRLMDKLSGGEKY